MELIQFHAQFYQHQKRKPSLVLLIIVYTFIQNGLIMEKNPKLFAVLLPLLTEEFLIIIQGNTFLN
jgi:hypothetical protein